MHDDVRDQKKLEDIYLRYRNLMYIQANNILNNHHDAEDAVQQAFVKIYGHIREIDISCKERLTAFLVTTARNSAIDIFRKKERLSLVDPEDCSKTVTIHFTRNRVLDCINRLPENYREVMILKRVYAYSSQETARILNTTVSNVNKLYQRARQKLEYLCREEGIL